MLSIDALTGETLSRESTTVSFLPKEPPYIKVYIQDISRLYGMTPSAGGLLYELASRMSYDGTVCIVSCILQSICEKLKIKPQTFRNLLDKFLKNGILCRVGRGVFELNPDLFAKGDWVDISKRRLEFQKRIKNQKLQVIIDYDCNTGERKITSILKPKSKN